MDADSAARDDAVRRLHARRHVLLLGAAFVVINGFLWVAWAVNDSEAGEATPWPLWVTILWSAGVALCAWGSFHLKPITQRRIDEEVARRRR